MVCVRNPPGRWTASNASAAGALEPSGIFKFDPSGTVYSRAEGLMGGSGMIGFALSAVRRSRLRRGRERLLLVRYEGR